MKYIQPKDFTAKKAWAALDITKIQNATVKLHWTDKPYKWHVNDGEEVFAVLDGNVDMHYKIDGVEKIVSLKTGDIFFAEAGDAHVAHPVGEARILVIEQDGSE
jgi:mannose-6-phosphate isomerase-like protein (cupin superfamily)